jgi:hypothetical protein
MVMWSVTIMTVGAPFCPLFVWCLQGARPAARSRCRAGSRRGGSSRLVASEPFASTFDERWNLSLCAPVDVLHDGEA